LLNLILFRYEIKDDYKPPVANIGAEAEPSSSTPAPAATTDTPNPSNPPDAPKEINSSSLVSFNLGLSLICILLTFTSNIYFKY
jgi:hypothetical protein